MAAQQQWPRGQTLNLRARETRANIMPGMTTRELDILGETTVPQAI